MLKRLSNKVEEYMIVHEDSDEDEEESFVDPQDASDSESAVMNRPTSEEEGMTANLEPDLRLDSTVISNSRDETAYSSEQDDTQEDAMDIDGHLRDDNNILMSFNKMIVDDPHEGNQIRSPSCATAMANDNAAYLSICFHSYCSTVESDCSANCPVLAPNLLPLVDFSSDISIRPSYSLTSSEENTPRSSLYRNPFADYDRSSLGSTSSHFNLHDINMSNRDSRFPTETHPSHPYGRHSPDDHFLTETPPPSPVYPTITPPDTPTPPIRKRKHKKRTAHLQELWEGAGSVSPSIAGSLIQKGGLHYSPKESPVVKTAQWSQDRREGIVARFGGEKDVATVKAQWTRTNTILSRIVLDDGKTARKHREERLKEISLILTK